MDFTDAQLKAVATVPKITSVLSMLGSSLIIKEVTTDKKKLSKSFYRLLLGLSWVDATTSIFYFLSTWPIPQGTPETIWAVGTVETCTLQGFFLQISLAAPVYNACLAVYHVLQIRYNWKDDALLRWEKASHGLAVTFGLGTALASLPLNLFNSMHFWCWIASVPYRCHDEIERGERAKCERGQYSWRFRLAFGYIPLLSCILIGSVSMVMVYHYVLGTEKKMEKYSFESPRQGNNSSPNNRNKKTTRKYSRKVARQGFFYIFAFLVAWVPSTLSRIHQLNPQTHDNWHFPLAFLMAFMNPIQGLLNFMVYVGPRYKKYKRANPAASCCKLLRHGIRKAFACRKVEEGGGNDAIEESDFEEEKREEGEGDDAAQNEEERSVTEEMNT